MFRFADWSVFYYLYLVPLIWILAIIVFKLSQKKLRAVLGNEKYIFLAASVSWKKRTWKIILQSLVVLFFVIALARPQFTQSTEKIKSLGIEIMFLVDVSQSMLAEDVKPSRLEHAKKELDRFSGYLTGDKVGLVAFAGGAALLCPLTVDKSALRMYLESLSTHSISAQGTDFKTALEVAKESFRRGGQEGDQISRTTKAIVIASDGEDNEKGAMEIAESLAKEGIRIFSLAFGTEKGAPIPLRDGSGYLKGYKKDNNNQVILSQTTGHSLKELAQKGRGSFYHVSFGGDAVRQVAEQIRKLEQTEFDSEVATQYDERFQIFLLIGILLALIELFLGERKKEGRIWKGRFEVAES